MRAAGALLLALVSGCNHVQLSGGTFYVQSGPATLAVVSAAVLAANIDRRNDFASGAMPSSMRPAPAMLADRAVAEQDCTKPIEDWSANLKCR